MPSLRRALLLTALVAVLPAASGAQGGAPLRVVRVTPDGDASPLATITVTFDRPVAGSLDRTVDAATVLRVEPAVGGKPEWRDPMTIRLAPAAALIPGRQYTVTVANTFRAMDGSALGEPHRFVFRVQGPTLIGGLPVGPDMERQEHITPRQRFALVYSSPVDLAKLSTAAYLEFSASCAPQRVVRLQATTQRRIDTDDHHWLREAGGWRRERAADSLRRVVQLTPQTDLPLGCAGELIAPTEVDDQAAPKYARFGFSTYGELRLSKVQCGGNEFCPAGPLTVTFTNPVRGAEVQRRLRLIPDAKITIRDTSAESQTWTLEANLKPHVGYAVIADTAMRDIFGQSLRGNPALGYRTTGYAPAVKHPFGRLLVERKGFRTLAVEHVNVDTLVATIAPVPDSLEARMLGRYAWADDDPLSGVVPGIQRIAVRGGIDRPMVSGLPLPAVDARRAGTPTLFAVKIIGRSSRGDVSGQGPTALVQVTDLGVHARVGASDAAVWVTGVSDGVAKQGATVVLHDSRGRRLATAVTDARGLARLSGWSVPKVSDDEENGWSYSFEGYVSVTLGDDRAITAINRSDPDLSPWRFNVASAWGDDRHPVAGAVFTERGIYRPGERVYAKAIVRDGPLGSLRVPAAGDSIKWLFHDREEGTLREVTTRLSAFGTADQSITLPAGVAIGDYGVSIQAKRQGTWRSVGRTSYRVAEYRPPEFLVDLTAEETARYPGQSLATSAQARYLFGARMGRAAISWQARQTSVYPWEVNIPGVEDWHVGDVGQWWEWDDTEQSEVFASKTDTLDARGEGTFSVKLPESPKGRAVRVSIDAAVTDINRQVVGANVTTLVHPAELYVAAKPVGDSYFWRVGTAQPIAILTVRPDGQKVGGVRVNGTIVRREWHRVRRERDGVSSLVGDWVSDTVAKCAVTSAESAVQCPFTPSAGGVYIVTLKATDRNGRVATTSFNRWAAGPGWIPWSDETQFKMDVIPDRSRYSVGDTATVMLASPFVNAEAWITIEREGLIEQRRMRLTSGSTTLKIPITEAHAPNAFVSVIVARGRSAPPGSLDDDGRPTIRVGYAELRVTPEVKRLTVALEPEKTEYRPADSARVRIRVRDVRGGGPRSEVTLWAVDEGVLALTAYKTPDPIDLIYRARGLGMRLASNMTSVAPQVPEGEKGRREAGGGGGTSGADILRSRFQTTAFFLGSVVTDAQGNAVATAKLPDNITTFRIMAVAVTAGDRYGKGESPMLVTRPLLARQALPRFVRPSDAFTAGAVINRRDASEAKVNVKATATGVTLRGQTERSATLAASKGAEVRFPFVAMRGDSGTFRFDVTDGRDADAVRVTIPVRPDYHPVGHTIAGVLRDTATTELMLPAGIDPERSRLSLHIGVSPLVTVRGMYRWLRVYPYMCSEQLLSTTVPLIALHRAQRLSGEAGSDRSLREIARAVDLLSARIRSDGGVGYWSSSSWSSSWLSAYAGMTLLDARDLGVKVDAAVVEKLASYVKQDLQGSAERTFTPLVGWYRAPFMRLRDQVAAVDFLSRLGRPEVAAENELLRAWGLLTVEDRARFAEVLVRRGQTAAARRLMEPTWALVRMEGSRAVLPDSVRKEFYFESRMRPIARVLSATLAVDPNHPLVGPLAEALAQHSRAVGHDWHWNTQDYSSAISALGELDKRRRAQGERAVRVRSGRKVLFEGATGARVGNDSSIALTGLLSRAENGQALRLTLEAAAGDAPIYYYFTVSEVPSAQPVSIEDRGIRVERWYENFTTGKPTTTAVEGDLVRVRLKITVPSTRYFLVLDDALPAGLEAVDLSLRTASAMAGPGSQMKQQENPDEERTEADEWGYGYWDSGWWSPFDHREIRDDRVVYSATVLWPGTYTATYIARATTPGSFIRPPAHAEEMYNPAVNGRSDGGTFVITEKGR